MKLSQLATAAYLILMTMTVSGCKEERKASSPPAEWTPVSVRVVQTPSGFVLERQGRPYRIRGAGATQHFERIREAGGNSVRLWTADYAGPLLDEAHRNGLTVMLGLWLAPEGKAMDYNDRTAVQTQLQRIRGEVLRFRKHPALLMWCIGNELDLGKVNPKMYSAMNEVAVMIHKLDPNHPVTTPLAVIATSIPLLQRRAPAIDVLSVNKYGGLNKLPEQLRIIGWKGPYIVTEYGTKGYWESDSTKWAVPLELNSAQKAAFIAKRYRHTMVEDSAHCLGSYVFFWGTKFEKTPTWFSLFSEDGEKTLAVDTLQYLWQGKKPANFAPSIIHMTLAGKRDVNFPHLRTNTEYPATAVARDPESQALTAEWELWPELPPTANADEPVEPLTGYISQPSTHGATLRTPLRPGAYRLLLWIHDGHGGVATANIPFYCEGGKSGQAAGVPAEAQLR
ncbi:glycoside hydrolase family 2 TIM barrel-domain containing protein [Hymenobacter sedentarius]|uniref:glycoside hydrolase family 2 TIM barrel-domain containing protein n=1 Tax=Hymenobacter sedentarius TaxID=1411621 RepID=UPI0009EB6C0B|nr:glycoside hydrolase family 2 TIM barrel-domain containing protein [Hymenobacter sedentarius]